MSEMKLIMESWRKFSDEDREYDKALSSFIECYASSKNIVLTEGVFDNIKKKIGSITQKYGKKAVTSVLLASMVAGIIPTNLAHAASPNLDKDRIEDVRDQAKQDKKLKKQLIKAIKDNPEVLDALKGALNLDDTPDDTPDDAHWPGTTDLFVHINLADSTGLDAKTEQRLQNMFASEVGDMDIDWDNIITPAGIENHLETKGLKYSDIDGDDIIFTAKTTQMDILSISYDQASYGLNIDLTFTDAETGEQTRDTGIIPQGNDPSGEIKDTREYHLSEISKMISKVLKKASK